MHLWCLHLLIRSSNLLKLSKAGKSCINWHLFEFMWKEIIQSAFFWENSPPIIRAHAHTLPGSVSVLPGRLNRHGCLTAAAIPLLQAVTSIQWSVSWDRRTGAREVLVGWDHRTGDTSSFLYRGVRVSNIPWHVKIISWSYNLHINVFLYFDLE